MKFLNRARLGVLLALMSSQGALAGGESTAGNGGDPLIARKNRIIRLLTGNPERHEVSIKTRVLNLLKDNPTWDYVENPEARKMLNEMRWKGLREDVEKSAYEIHDVCIDMNNVSQPATAKPDDRAGGICWNPSALAAMNASDDEIVALAFHEHAHHFGILDPEMQINTAILQLIALQATPKPVTRPKSVVTSIGWEFKRVSHPEFGTTYVAPNGIVWSGILAKNVKRVSDAVAVCLGIGARLPTKTEFEHLMGYFPLKDPFGERSLSREGRLEFHSIYPDMKGSILAFDPNPPGDYESALFLGTFGYLTYATAVGGAKMVCVDSMEE